MDDLVVSSERSLRDAGRRLTAQRRLIVRILTEAGGHLDAREVYERARLQGALLNLSTVYRTLSVLKQVGTVRELHLDEEHHHYEIDDKGGHSHLICRRCGRVIEVDGASFARTAMDLAQQHGFQVTGAVVELTGYCAECQGQHLD